MALAILSASLFPALADLAIDWHTIDSGGGTSSGGRFSVSGTIGQPDAAGLMTSPTYSATGGFWPLPAVVQTPGAPLLRITPGSPGLVTLSWSPDTPGWVLQEAPGLDPADWTDAASSSTNPATVPVSNAKRFYRLRGPR